MNATIDVEVKDVMKLLPEEAQEMRPFVKELLWRGYGIAAQEKFHDRQQTDGVLNDALVAYLADHFAHLPEEAEDLKTWARIHVRQAFLNGIQAERRAQQQLAAKLETMSGAFASHVAVPSVGVTSSGASAFAKRLPHNCHEVLAAPGTAPENCSQCGKPMQMAYITPTGCMCWECVTEFNRAQASR